MYDINLASKGLIFIEKIEKITVSGVVLNLTVIEFVIWANLS